MLLPIIGQGFDHFSDAPRAAVSAWDGYKSLMTAIRYSHLVHWAVLSEPKDLIGKQRRSKTPSPEIKKTLAQKYQQGRAGQSALYFSDNINQQINP